MTRGFLISDGLHRDIKRTIARVDGMPDGSGPTKIPTRFESLPASTAKVFRICTFTGAWAIGGTKPVTFKNVTTTPNTVSVTNLFFPITSTATITTNCAIAKDGTAWYLIDVPFATATAVFVGSTTSGIAVQSTATGIAVQSTATGIAVSSTATSSSVTDITLSATLDTSNCTISIGKTLTTASNISITGTATSIFVTGTATSVFVTGTATSVFVSTTFTATFVTFGR